MSQEEIISDRAAERFLMIDDQPDDVELIAQALADAFPGGKIEIARTAEEGLEKAARHDLTLILLDYKLPRKSGLEILPALRRSAPDAGIIMLTGHGDEQVAVQAMRGGADYYLKKSADLSAEVPLVVREALEKRQLRAALSRTEDRYRRLIENMTDIVYELNEEGQFRYISSAVLDILGYTPQELMGKHFSHLLHPEDLPRCGRRFHERRTGIRATRRLELRLVAKTGEARSFEVNAAGVYDHQRRFYATAGIARDITERKRIAYTLRTTEKWLGAIMEAAPDAIFMKDLEGRYLMANPMALGILNPQDPRLEAVIGKTDAELLDAATAEDFVRTDRLVLESGKPVSRKAQEVTLQGTRTWDTITVPYLDEQGHVQGLIGVSRDITAQLRLEEQARRADKLHAIGQLVAGVAHELNNPLTGIIGHTELTLRDVHDPLARETLEIVYAQARRAAKIVQNLLSFARPQSPHRAPVPLAAVVEAVLRVERPKLADARITVERDLPKDLKPVLADPHQLEQVLTNLISNAMQAMTAAHGHGRLRISARPCRCRPEGTISPDPAGTDEYVELEVTDDGPGIPADDREKIFTPFFTTKPVGEGSGLGLAVVYGIIQEHRGTIAVRDAAGGGASFLIQLPVAEGGEAKGVRNHLSERPEGRCAQMVPDPLAVSDAAPLTSPRLAVVIDDEASIRSFLTALLEEEGFAVAAYAHGGEAWAALTTSAKPPCLIFLDFRMPVMDGITFFSRLADYNPALAQRVIFCTGDLLSPEVQAITATHSNIALVKPFGRSAVREAIRAALARLETCR